MHLMGHLVPGSSRRDGVGCFTTFIMLFAILQNFGISGVAATYYSNCSTVTITRILEESNPYGPQGRTITKTVTTMVPTTTTQTTTYTETVPVPTTIVSTIKERGSGVITTTTTETETATKTVFLTISGVYGDYGDYGDYSDHEQTTVIRTVTNCYSDQVSHRNYRRNYQCCKHEVSSHNYRANRQRHLAASYYHCSATGKCYDNNVRRSIDNSDSPTNYGCHHAPSRDCYQYLVRDNYIACSGNDHNSAW
ncbi:hypothetical protein BGX38DRAFT_652145 [Terfezia claveryi]|nr:hypothetical protein BGX38DRAFT_652145 [Terfezia claveryi]